MDAFLVVDVPFLQLDPEGVVDACSADAVRTQLNFPQPLLVSVHVSADVGVLDRLLTQVHENLLVESALSLWTSRHVGVGLA